MAMTDAQWRKFLEEMRWAEAEASVALDRDSGVHTCHAECRHPSHEGKTMCEPCQRWVSAGHTCEEAQ